MQINDGEMTVVKSKNFENNYFTSEVKKDKQTGELITDENGKIRRLYKTVFLPEGTTIENTAKIRFRGYSAISIKEDGTINEYIAVQEILEFIQNNNTQENTSSNEFEFGDGLPF